MLCGLPARNRDGGAEAVAGAGEGAAERGSRGQKSLQMGPRFGSRLLTAIHFGVLFKTIGRYHLHKISWIGSRLNNRCFLETFRMDIYTKTLIWIQLFCIDPIPRLLFHGHGLPFQSADMISPETPTRGRRWKRIVPHAGPQACA
jgi:hypothetical protein